MKPITAFGLALAAAIVWKLLDKREQVGLITDPAPSLENLKRGIANGWYTAQLTSVDGKLAVRLSGKRTDGKLYSDVYPITPEVAEQLKQMGVPIV